MPQIKLLSRGILFVGAMCVLMNLFLAITNLTSGSPDVDLVFHGVSLGMVAGVAIMSSLALRMCEQQFQAQEARLRSLEENQNRDGQLAGASSPVV